MSFRPFRSLALPLVVLCACFLPGHARESDEKAPTDPRDLGLVERSERRLAQLDVTATGPMPDVGELTADDFELVVDGEFVPEILVDRVCRVDQGKDSGKGKSRVTQPAPQGDGTVVSTRTLPATFLFYFDQQHLTLYGRQSALDIARTLVPELIRGGNRGLLVSNASELKTYADLTEDPAVLLDAIDRLEADKTQWDPFPQLEQQRINDVLDSLRQSDEVDRAKAMARRYQREEKWHTDRALRRFATVVGRLADVDSPKAVVYFADTMRSNAGEHYLSFFSRREAGLDSSLDAMALDSFSARNPFDRVLDEAAAHGARIYSIQAEGLVSGMSTSMLGGGRPNSGGLASGNGVRISDAQNSLVSMARETGGQAFLNGVRSTQIAREIRRDLSCLYLISFDASAFAEDRTLPVLLRVKRPRVKAQVRGQILMQSESRRRTSRLLSAFSSPEIARTPGSTVSGRIIPVGFEDGRYRAMVQVAVPGSSLANTEWDIGTSVVSRGAVRDENSGKIAVKAPNVPVVFETEVRFAPGPFEVIMVAHETRTDQILTGQIDGAWPDPNEASVTLGPLSAVQPAVAAFLRDGNLRNSGGLAADPEAGLRTDLPTALIGIVCRARGRKGGIEVERRLVGESATGFPDMQIEFGSQRCAQIRDIIPTGIMTPGTFVYEVVLWNRGEKLASRSYPFVVADTSGTPPTDDSGPYITPPGKTDPLALNTPRSR